MNLFELLLMKIPSFSTIEASTRNGKSKQRKRKFGAGKLTLPLERERGNSTFFLSEFLIASI